jgi:hypothetical protein
MAGACGAGAGIALPVSTVNMRAVRAMWLVATLVAGANLTARAASPEANAKSSADAF